jgi:HEAT repeat protein
MRVLPLVVLVLFATGCGKSGPNLAGGKPVSHWLEALNDPDPKTRRTAAFKLGNAGPTDREIFPALMGALRDPDASVRCEIILAVLKFGPHPSQLGPELSDMRENDPDAKVRAYAAKALAHLESRK